MSLRGIQYLKLQKFNGINNKDFESVHDGYLPILFFKFRGDI